MVRSPLRRHLIAVSLFLTITMLVFALGSQAFADIRLQGDSVDQDHVAPADSGAPRLTYGSTGQTFELELVEPFGVLAAPAEDDCSLAPMLVLSPGNPESGQTDATSATPALGDPALSCMWGTPIRNEGHRTVWYSFDAMSYGRVTIDTQGSSYDTVLAVHTGGCGGTVEVACSDDHKGFTSRVSLDVVQGLTYYVEVADWQEHPPSGGALLSLVASMVPVNSNWESAGVMSLPRSRFATAIVGNHIYVIGGQSGPLGAPVIEKRVDRYNTASGNWVNRAGIPGPSGYANTTAAYVDGPNDTGRIYVPSGDTGNPTSFGGDHWAYDVVGNFWITATNAPWPGGVPIAWSAAVAGPAGNGYYLTGGLSSQPPLDPNAQVHNDVFYYTPPPTDSWSVVQPMSSTRYAHTAALVAGRVCVAGGISTGNVLLIDGECYDPGSNTWSPTGTMNTPRYAAAGGVGPDGKWYVFGGYTTNTSGQSVLTPVVEVYDPVGNNWTALDVRYDFGGSRSGNFWPDRAWPGGGFVGSTLWGIGGSDDQQIQPMMDRLFIGTHNAWMPLVASGANFDDVQDTFVYATQLNLNQPFYEDFYNQSDIDVFTFVLPAPTLVTVTLNDIPVGKNFDLSVYTANKLLLGNGENLGSQPETVPLMLATGRYYIMVERISGFAQPGEYYRLMVED